MGMRLPRYVIAIVVAFAGLASLPAPITGFADELPPTLLTERGKLLLADDWDRPLDKA